MKNSQETMTKVIDRLLDPQRILPCAWCVQYTPLHDNIFPILSLIKIDKIMEIIIMYYTIIGPSCENQNQCPVQKAVSGYGIFFLQTLLPRVLVLSSHCM